ncbi:unnamed protein product [Soboliphyme baturini]|uniref:Secreted protein n=1 Tax=Soboliphyme baturini TaxID=241478 RepID=A0A183J284_9BILA|nr:unnamed protein product [Soboliphyme baturini]
MLSLYFIAFLLLAGGCSVKATPTAYLQRDVRQIDPVMGGGIIDPMALGGGMMVPMGVEGEVLGPMPIEGGIMGVPY